MFLAAVAMVASAQHFTRHTENSALAYVAPEGGRVRVEIPPGRCRVRVNGKPVSWAQFGAALQNWHVTQPEVHFMPSPQTSYRCVDRVLGMLRRADVTRLGFVGNEVAEPEKQQ